MGLRSHPKQHLSSKLADMDLEHSSGHPGDTDQGANTAEGQARAEHADLRVTENRVCVLALPATCWVPLD